MRLNQKQFDALAKKAFGSVLEPHGFSCASSKRCTFYRKASEDLYHFIVPDPLIRLPKYDIKVFFSSPILEQESWAEKFPDDLGIPTDSCSYLHAVSGVGPDQQLFWCRTEEGLLNDFDQRIRPALLSHAIPYLSRYQSLQSAVPAIRHKHYLGIAEKYR